MDGEGDDARGVLLSPYLPAGLYPGVLAKPEAEQHDVGPQLPRATAIGRGGALYPVSGGA